MSTVYNEGFYRAQKDGSYNSARIVIPIVKEYVSPKTVIDVGCGLGTWLAVWEKEGAEIQGYDGSYVKKDMLYIPREKFRAVDLSEDTIEAESRVDLAMSREVAEHLPAARAEFFVRNLTELSDVVLFSAAIPYQGGTNHINEQWQSYWANFFAKEGYVPVDCIRPRIWWESVVLCYVQNTLIYVKEDCLPNYPALRDYYASHKDSTTLDLVHPATWQLTMKHLEGKGE